MQRVRYYDECKWKDTGEGMTFEFLDDRDEKMAEASLVDFDAKLWKYEVLLPEKFQVDGQNAIGIVYSAPAAKKVAEVILLNTILMKV